jgi:hypothetical protein
MYLKIKHISPIDAAQPAPHRAQNSWRLAQWV